MAEVRITEFTDPACPWAWSAEPFRRRLRWLYDDRLEWMHRMVVLSDTPEEVAKKMTTRGQAANFRRIAHDHGMPIDTRVRPRLAASLPACRAVVSVRVHAPERVERLLRELRVLHFSGEVLDEPGTILRAGVAAGIGPDELERWTADPRVDEALADDRKLARQPSSAARVLDEKLANWSGGRRYTCPSYEIERVSDGVRVAVPGFQPFAVYDVVIANLVPGVDRRPPPATVEEALRWADCPVATREVEVLCELEHEDAREALGRVAVERHVGADGFWTLAEDGADG